MTHLLLARKQYCVCRHLLAYLSGKIEFQVSYFTSNWYK